MKIKIANCRRSLSFFKKGRESVGKDYHGNLYYEGNHFALRRVESKTNSFMPVTISQEHSSILI